MAKTPPKNTVFTKGDFESITDDSSFVPKRGQFLLINRAGLSQKLVFFS